MFVRVPIIENDLKGNETKNNIRINLDNVTSVVPCDKNQVRVWLVDGTYWLVEMSASDFDKLLETNSNYVAYV